MVIGIDEVGRGPLAGPVVVAAVLIATKTPIRNAPAPLRDSKQLSEGQRLRWFQWIKQHPGIHYAIARIHPKTIDRINIARAANLAAYRVYQKLLKLLKKHFQSQYYRHRKSIILDGGLHLPKHIPHKTIIRGDEKYTAIALASIIAKTTRDRYMKKKHACYPEYQFNNHVGYGTRAHIKALKKYGPSPLHRLTFIKNFVKIKTI